MGVLTRVFPADLVDEVVSAHGRKEKRSRLLPARVVVYFVLALALFGQESYEEVIRRLVGGLRFCSAWSQAWAFPSRSALSQARGRLGEEPVQALFERVAVPLATPGTPGAWLGRYRLMAIDGLVLDAADTAENEEAFGRTRGPAGSTSPFPQVRLTALAECGTHALVAANMGAVARSEHDLAKQLLDRVEPDMLVIVDRGLPSYRLFTDLITREAAALFRVSAQYRLPRLQSLPDGSYLSVLVRPDTGQDVHRDYRSRLAKDPAAAAEYLRARGALCRVVEYTVEGAPTTFRLITSILDPDAVAAHELAAAYQQRWEIELIFDEIEVHQVAGRRVLRSKSPQMVRQEIWGILLTHYAVRHFMHEAAERADLDEDRLSFLTALRIIRHQISADADFSPLTKESDP